MQAFTDSPGGTSELTGTNKVDFKDDDLKGFFLTIVTGNAAGQRREILGNVRPKITINDFTAGVAVGDQFSLFRPRPIAT